MGPATGLVGYVVELADKLLDACARRCYAVILLTLSATGQTRLSHYGQTTPRKNI